MLDPQSHQLGSDHLLNTLVLQHRAQRLGDPAFQGSQKGKHGFTELCADVFTSLCRVAIVLSVCPGERDAMIQMMHWSSFQTLTGWVAP